MKARDLFSNTKKYISRKQMRENYRYDSSFKKIMSDPAMAKILDRPVEQKKFHDLLLEKAKDRKLDYHDMRKIADELAHGKVGDITSVEGRAIARTIFPDSTRRYEHENPEPEKSSNDALKSPKIQPKSKKDSVGKASSVPPTYSTYRSKSVAASSDLSKAGSKKTSYFNALRSVERNK